MSRVRAPAASTGPLARGVDKREVRQHENRLLPGANRTSGCRRGREEPGGARPSAGQGSRAQRRVRSNFQRPARVDWPRRLAGRAAWRRHCPSGEGARHPMCQWRRFGNGLTAATWMPTRDFHRTSTDACPPKPTPTPPFHRISTTKTHREKMHVRLRNLAEFPRPPFDSARITRILGPRVDSERGTACPADRVGP